MWKMGRSQGALMVITRRQSFTFVVVLPFSPAARKGSGLFSATAEKSPDPFRRGGRARVNRQRLCVRNTRSLYFDPLLESRRP